MIEIEKEEGITFTMDNLERRLKQMVDKGHIELEETIFGNRYKIKWWRLSKRNICF